MRHKHFFNLIEIALATAVIAIGLSSLLVLFPVGLNASRDATADNVIPDVADYVLGSLQLYVTQNWRDAAGTPKDPESLLPTIRQNALDTVTIDTFNKNQKVNDSLWHDTVSKLFLFNKSTPIEQADGTKFDVVDFAALITAWVEPVYIKTTANTPVKVDKKIAVTLCVELAWPAEKPDKAREHRVYRMEIFNPAYKP